MESKYNLLTRLLKNIKNVITPDGGVAGSGGVLVVHEVEQQGEVLLDGTLPNVDGYLYSSSHGEGAIAITVTGIANKDLSEIVVTIGEKVYNGTSDLDATGDNTLLIRLKDEQMTPESAITGLAITVIGSCTALDKTYKEIVDAGFAVLHDDDEGTSVYPLAGFGSFKGGYIVAFPGSGTFIAETENDYPALVVQDASVPGDLNPGDNDSTPAV